MAKIASNIVGNIGLFYACYQLSRQGWNVLPTSRNTAGIDIIIYKTVGKRYEMTHVQVKTVSDKSGTFTPAPDKLMGDWWIIVTEAQSDEDPPKQPTAYILTREEVQKHTVKDGGGYGLVYAVRESGKNYEKRFNKKKFKEKWGRIKVQR